MMKNDTLFLLDFNFLGLRDPYFQEIMYFFVFVRAAHGVFALLNLGNLLINAATANKSYL